MALDRSIAQRSIVDQRLVSYRAELAQFNELPNSLILMGKERETFAAFMATCRGRTGWVEDCVVVRQGGGETPTNGYQDMIVIE